MKLRDTKYERVVRTGLGGEDPEAVVPEAGGDEEARVDGGDEAVAARAHALREVVAQLAPRHARAARRCAHARYTHHTMHAGYFVYFCWLFLCCG